MNRGSNKCVTSVFLIITWNALLLCTHYVPYAMGPLCWGAPDMRRRPNVAVADGLRPDRHQGIRSHEYSIITTVLLESYHWYHTPIIKKWCSRDVGRSLTRRFLCNTLNPGCWVAIVVHQVRCMYEGHLGLFHRAIFPLNRYKMIRMEGKPTHLFGSFWRLCFLCIWNLGFPGVSIQDSLLQFWHWSPVF